ncbi:hypothetical protein CNMCM5623_004800 [Aspergillus felis]|uniref:AT hook motif protein n=1 Tax=Aspergillus felis TaxID=1287682 RepID=A0A8H6QFE4_9EURO|nr:hypothetical protein CNMCM5623_004800 [Aspergillus felis]
MPMTWDREADAKLLLRIFTTSNIKLDYEDLAKHMGADCTTIAIKSRIQRLRIYPGDGGAVNGDSSAPASPEKRKRGRGKKDANGDAADKASPKKVKKEENDSAVDSA